MFTSTALEAGAGRVGLGQSTQQVPAVLDSVHPAKESSRAQRDLDKSAEPFVQVLVLPVACGKNTFRCPRSAFYLLKVSPLPKGARLMLRPDSRTL